VDQGHAGSGQFKVVGYQKTQAFILLTLVPQAMKSGRYLGKIKGAAVGFMGLGRTFDKTRPSSELFYQSKLGRVGQAMECRIAQSLVRYIEIGKGFKRQTGDGTTTGMGVLNIENRVIAGLFGHLGEIEIERRIILAGQHDKTHHILANLVDHLAQGDEGAGAFRHFYLLALVEQIDELADFDVETPLAAGYRGNSRLHALYIAAVIGAPDIDHFGIEAAVARLVGPDKLTVKGLWGYDLINSDSQSSDDRNRTMVGGTVTYQMFRHLIGKSRDALGGSFEMRGVEFFGGLLHDEERFGSTIVEKEDFFGGVTVQQIAIPALSAVAKSFDITVQGTLLRSEISNDSTQENAQFRTNVTLLARLIDEEDMPYVPEQPSTVNAAYLHLAIPFIYDTAVDGPDYFENISIGAEIRGKLYSRSARGASALLVCGYQWTNYFNIDEQLHGYHVSIRLGF